MSGPLTRARVIEAARRALERDGAEQLSFRAVARDLGVTAPALYAHVESRQDLLAAVAAGHFEALAQQFEAVDTPDPIERIRTLSRIYVDHALSSPVLFRLMLRFPPAATPDVDAFPPATRAFNVAAAATTAAVDAGLLAVDDPDLASMTMWAAVHGVAEVLLLGFGFDDQGAETLISSVIDTVIAGQVRPLPPGHGPDPDKHRDRAVSRTGPTPRARRKSTPRRST